MNVPDALPMNPARVRVLGSLLACLGLLLSFGRPAFAQQVCIPPPSGAIAWWPFDETSGTTTNDIVGGHAGVQVNAPQPTPGLVAGSLRFDGFDDYVAVQDSDAWAFGTGDFTIEFWVNFGAPPGGFFGHDGAVFIGNDEGGGGISKWFFAARSNDTSNLDFHTNGPSSTWATAPFSPELGQWYHLAATRSGTTLTLYVNGQVIGTGPAPETFANPNALLTIGYVFDYTALAPVGHLNGQLDELTIYSRVLTQTELGSILAAGSGGKCKALSISTTKLSAVQINAFSTQQLEARSGSAPFSWSVVTGELPSGMTLSADGTLSGTPTVAGSFPLTIKVADSQNQAAQKVFALDVLLVPPPPQIRANKVGIIPVPGRAVDYFIVLENVAGSTANNVNAVEVLEPEFRFLSADPPPNLMNDASLHWSIPALSPGDSRVLTYSVRLDPAVPEGTIVRGSSFWEIHSKVQDPPFPTCATDYCVLALDICQKCTGGCYDPCAQARVVCTQDCGGATAPGAVQRPKDPNEKLVVAGRFVPPEQTLVYPIHFENLGTIEARDVFVTDVLDPALDGSTLTILTPEGASFDPATRTLKWSLLNLNLPPGQTGSLLFSAKPGADLPSGTVIRNRAIIQFEVFESLDTNTVETIIDKTRPSCAVNALPAETNTADVPISWNGTDAVGEIESYSVLVSRDGGPFEPFLDRVQTTSGVFRGEAGRAYGFLCVAKDTAGNIETQDEVAEATTRIVSQADLMAPAASPAQSPAANGAGWNNSDVTVIWNWSDEAGGSGIDSASCTMAGTSTGEGNPITLEATCNDLAGNIGHASHAVKVDKTPPTVSLVGGPADGGTYYFGSVPAAPTCRASDALSGLDGSCILSGYGKTLGSHTVTARADDVAGNQSVASATYEVLPLTLKGFYQPVDMGGMWNIVKGGSTVPLKFEVFAGSTELTDPSVVNKPLTATAGVCAGGSTGVFELSATGATSLRYDPSGGQFIYNWKTPKNPGHCYDVTVTLADGSSISANFRLK